MTTWGNDACPRCDHAPSRHYRHSWLDKLLRSAKSEQYCTVYDEGDNPSGHPELCLCSDSYHRQRFL